MRFDDVATLPIVSRWLVILGWVIFFVRFVLMRRPAPETVVRRERAASLGILLQMVGFALVWMFQRPIPRAGAALSAAEITLDVIAPIVSGVSIWMGLAAVRTLGKQWAYAARVIEGHRLIVSGPYRFVRHPIYSAMIGKLIAANFAFGHWLGLVISLPILMIGTLIRTRSEEKILRAEFGAEYDDYARRVPGLIPGLG